MNHLRAGHFRAQHFAARHLAGVVLEEARAKAGERRWLEFKQDGTRWWPHRVPAPQAPPRPAEDELDVVLPGERAPSAPAEPEQGGKRRRKTRRTGDAPAGIEPTTLTIAPDAGRAPITEPDGWWLDPALAMLAIAIADDDDD